MGMAYVGGSGSKKNSTTDPTRGYANQDGPGNTTVDYGPHKGGFTDAGLTSPRWSDRDPSYDYTPEQLAAENAAGQARADQAQATLMQDPAYAQAYANYQGASGKDRENAFKELNRAHEAAASDMQRQRFVDQGGQASTWDNRYANENDYPRPTSSNGYSHGPGRPDYATRDTNPSPYGPGNSAPPMQGGFSGNTYTFGPGSPYNSGSFAGGGGYNPNAGGMQGGGQPFLQGGPAGGMGMYDPSAQFGGGMMGGGQFGGGMGGGMNPAFLNMLRAAFVRRMMGGGGYSPAGGSPFSGRGSFGSAAPQFGQPSFNLMW